MAPVTVGDLPPVRTNEALLRLLAGTVLADAVVTVTAATGLVRLLVDGGDTVVACPPPATEPAEQMAVNRP